MTQKLAELLDVFYGLRKFIAFILVFIAALVFRVKQLISGDNLTTLITSTFAAFAAGNIVEHFTSAVKDYISDRADQRDSVKDTSPPKALGGSNES